MSNDRIFIITMEDTVIQIRDYVVKAPNLEQAQANVASGIFLNEGTPETIDATGARFRAHVDLGELVPDEVDPDHDPISDVADEANDV